MPSIVAVSPTKFAAAAASDNDALVVLYASLPTLAKAAGAASITALKPFAADIAQVCAVSGDGAALGPASVVPAANAPGGRLILAPVGSVSSDVDDARRYLDAAKAAFAKIRACKAVKPAIVCPDVPSDPLFKYAAEVAVLGALQELYDPLQTREHVASGGKATISSVSQVTVVVDRPEGELAQVTKWLDAIERGKILSRDVCQVDPIRGLPKRCAEIVKSTFAGIPSVKVTVIDDLAVLQKEYPLLYAVGRASLGVPDASHNPVVVRLEYRSPDQSKVKENLFFAGKGITYDTGGADVKAGGIMRGMSRDKGGAGIVSGVMASIGTLEPKTVNATAFLSFVRNSIGSQMYTSDEIIVSRNGTRCVVGNTDAEGRMVLCDPLCQLKEEALATVSDLSTVKLFTVATLTGHVVRAYGGYPAVVPVTGTANAQAAKIYEAGMLIGDPWEISSIRREDFDFVTATSSTEDVVQANTQPSAVTARGHQYPAAFLSIASGLRDHGKGSAKPLAYMHCDVAGSCEDKPKGGLSLGKANGGQVASLVATYLGSEFMPGAAVNGVNGTH